jgi:hypothetical protein
MNLASDLVARDMGKRNLGELSGGDFEIGAAKATSPHSNKDLLGSDGGNVHILDYKGRIVFV